MAAIDLRETFTKLTVSKCLILPLSILRFPVIANFNKYVYRFLRPHNKSYYTPMVTSYIIQLQSIRNCYRLATNEGLGLQVNVGRALFNLSGSLAADIILYYRIHRK